MTDEIIGIKIQSYRVVRQIGRGGMGNVYEARHEQIDRRAAIKVLHPEHARDAEMAQRFFNEARAANVVGHPGLVNIYELGTLDSGAAYIIMEFLDGESLRLRIRRPEGMAAGDALRIARQIAGALQAVHAKGIIHRDLKPDNIILVPDAEVSGGERAKVLDFGIAKLLHGNSESGRGPTHTGAVVGTPAYMAPEQCGMRTPITDRTDVYALGVMLYEMLAGKPPFYGEGPTALIGQHLFVDPPPLPEYVAADTAALVMRMLAKTPTERPSMSEVVSTLSVLGDFSRMSRFDMPVPLAVQQAAAAANSSSAVPPVSASGTSSAAVNTIGQSTGERVPAEPSSPRRGSPLLVVGLAGLVLASASSVVWIVFGSRPHRPAAAAGTLREGAVAPTPGVRAPPGVPPTAAPPPAAAGTNPPSLATPPAPPPAAAGTNPPSLAAAPAPPRATAAESAATCHSAFAHKHYIDAIAACNESLAQNPNQPAVRATLRSAVARLSATQRSRPAGSHAPAAAKAPTVEAPAPRVAPPPPPSPPPAPPPAPAPQVKPHYEKVKPID
jgi:serine/threonine protein kinase